MSSKRKYEEIDIQILAGTSKEIQASDKANNILKGRRDHTYISG